MGTVGSGQVGGIVAHRSLEPDSIGNSMLLLWIPITRVGNELLPIGRDNDSIRIFVHRRKLACDRRGGDGCGGSRSGRAASTGGQKGEGYEYDQDEARAVFQVFYDKNLLFVVGLSIRPDGTDAAQLDVSNSRASRGYSKNTACTRDEGSDLGFGFAFLW